MMEGNLEQELGQGLPATPEAESVTLSWTTQDEIDFIDSLYEEGKQTGDWKGLRQYPLSIARRRWDPTVDVEAVRLHARKRAADVEFFLALKEG